MKQYALFAGDEYYARGGWNDFINSFSTQEGAIEETANIDKEWWHVIDLSTGEIIATSKVLPWGNDNDRD